MSQFSRTRKQRQRFFNNFRKYNDYRLLGEWTVVDIHEFDPNFEEFDFWCSNSKDVYLLRLRKSKINQYFVSKSASLEAKIYLIAEINFTEINDELIKETLEIFTKKGIPKYTKNRINLNLNKRNSKNELVS